MADPDHLKILQQGVDARNAWREGNPDIIPNLRAADLRGADLSGADLHWADLCEANLSGATLLRANLMRLRPPDGHLGPRGSINQTQPTKPKEIMRHSRAFLLTAGFAALTFASAVLWPAASFAQITPDAMAKAVKADDIKWEPLGNSGDEISILYINPTTQATYLMIRNPPNQHIPRHWHSSNESITVIKGTFEVAHDGSGGRTVLTPGGFVYMPAKMIHEAWAGAEGATYFITVDGKWDINLVK